jgi:putative oxidoreductase
MIRSVAYLYGKLVWLLAYFAPVALLLLRLGWGYESFQSGQAHLSRAHFPEFVTMLTGLNVPHPQASAVVAGTTEMVGGLLIIIGFATRLIALPFAFNFAVAIATASKDNVTAFWATIKQFTLDLLNLLHIQIHHNVLHLPDDFTNLTSTFTKIVDDTAYPFLIMGLILIAFGPGLFSIDGVVKKIREKCPSFSARIGAIAYRWEATALATFVSIFAGYPLSYYLQPPKVKSAYTLSDYVCQISDLFKDQAIRNRAIIVWGSFVVVLVILGVVVDVFLLKRKPVVKRLDVQPAPQST